MKTKFNLLPGILALTLIMPSMVLADSSTKHEGSMTKHEHSDTKGMKEYMGMCPMYIEGAEVKAKNIKNGVEIKITSKDKEIAKKIQEKSQKCVDMKDVKAKAGDEMVTCPVMGTTFPKSKAVATREYKGKTYYLCCKSCISAWDKNPEKYAK